MLESDFKRRKLKIERRSLGSLESARAVMQQIALRELLWDVAN
jgi:hypothetical protein